MTQIEHTTESLITSNFAENVGAEDINPMPEYFLIPPGVDFF